jgi:Helix-turn-helix domain
MESQEHPDHSRVSDSFLTTLNRAERGDKRAMEQLLHLFESDIQYLATFIRLPREEAVQTLKAEFIVGIRSGSIQSIALANKKKEQSPSV